MKTNPKGAAQRQIVDNENDETLGFPQPLQQPARQPRAGRTGQQYVNFFALCVTQNQGHRPAEVQQSKKIRIETVGPVPRNFGTHINQTPVFPDFHMLAKTDLN
ncbi:MAG: hypothetical protein WCO56_02240 [Verrucomicrobiota bacterium]